LTVQYEIICRFSLTAGNTTVYIYCQSYNELQNIHILLIFIIVPTIPTYIILIHGNWEIIKRLTYLLTFDTKYDNYKNYTMYQSLAQDLLIIFNEYYKTWFFVLLCGMEMYSKYNK